MERPTCKTCAYWEVDIDYWIEDAGETEPTKRKHGESPTDFASRVLESGGTLKALCGRYPSSNGDRSIKDAKFDFDSCGEHSDFPDYIRSRKQTKEA